MVQIRKGIASNITNTNKNTITTTTTRRQPGVALVKLILLLIIGIQIVFIGYKCAVVVVTTWNNNVEPKPNTPNNNENKNNVRHVSRKEITKPMNHQQQEHALPLATGVETEEEEDEQQQQQLVLQQQQEHEEEQHHDENDQQQQDNNNNANVLKRFGTGPAREGYVVDLMGERQKGSSTSSSFQFHIPATKTTKFTNFNDIPSQLQPLPVSSIVIYDTTTRSIDETTSAASTNIIPTKTIQPCDVPCDYDIDLHGDIMNFKGGNEFLQLGVVGTNWKIQQTLSDPYYNNNAKIERTDYRRNKYYSTTSMKSSVPLSYYHFDTYNLRNTKPIDYHTAKHAATYLLNTNCGYGNRHKWVAAVQVVVPVEAFGSCQNNIPLGNEETLDTMEGRIRLMQKNRIVLAFEAGTDKDYITHIVWEALISGSVPAILGASNLQLDHLPPNSAIYANNFNSWDKFAAFVSNVSNNETLWNSYHTWRTDETALRQFEQRYAFVKSGSPECRLCRWAYTKLYGLGFNHTTQEIQSNRIVVRNNLGISTAVDDTGLIAKPFRERYYITNDVQQQKATDKRTYRSTTSSNDVITVYGPEMGTRYDIQRTVIEHDGVIDMTIGTIVDFDPLVNGPIVVRLEFDLIRNTDGAHFRNVHTWMTTTTTTGSEATQTRPLLSSIAIQDEYIKITAITNCITSVRSPAEGIIEIEIIHNKNNNDDVVPPPNGVDESIMQQQQQRIRIIVEDTNPIHDKLTEYFPSTFARQMMEDFIDPVEWYYTTTTKAITAVK